MSSENTNKVAVVTGGGAGIGRAISLALGGAGYNVVVSDIDLETAQKVADEINAKDGVEARALVVDAGKSEDQQNLVDFAVKEFGRLDAAVNNAGLGAPATLLADVDTETYDRAVNVTQRGTFFALKAQLKQLVENSGGAIVNIASIGGIRPSKRLGPYAAAKRATVSLSESAALDYADQSIRVNAIAPGPIKTESLKSLDEDSLRREEGKVPLQRLGDPEDIANATVFLLSDQANFITGTTLPVDGGSILV